MATGKIILASSSEIRCALLKRAGINVEMHPARVDEDMLKQSLLAENARPRDIADCLAEAKAQSVGRKINGQLVLGCDQILEMDGKIYSKAQNMNELYEQISQLSGNVHRLYTAAVFYFDGVPVWRVVERVEMQMRDLSQGFIQFYLDEVGDDVLNSVGGYQFEGKGAQLFASYRGDYFSILGLPLLPVLDFLRIRGVLHA